MILAVTVICKVHKVMSRQVTLACDNETAVYFSNDRRLDVPTSVSHADLVRAIRRLIKDLPISVKMIDVNGHRDRVVAFKYLSPHEQLNCLADWDAKALLRSHLKRIHNVNPPPRVSNHIHGEGIRCTIGGIKVTGNPRNAVLDHVFREPIARELDQKGTLAYTAFNYVNWEAIDVALAYRNPSFCAWVTKHVTGQCAVGRKMKAWNFWETDECPCCKQPDETTTHFPPAKVWI
jgi:hypothetical protein